MPKKKRLARGCVRFKQLEHEQLFMLPVVDPRRPVQILICHKPFRRRKSFVYEGLARLCADRPTRCRGNEVKVAGNQKVWRVRE